MTTCSLILFLSIGCINIICLYLYAHFQVSRSLGRLEGVNNFTEFVKAFSHFGTEMVELAHLTGERQNDLKDERRRSQIAAARQVLERSTMLLLTSSKVSIVVGTRQNIARSVHRL